MPFILARPISSLGILQGSAGAVSSGVERAGQMAVMLQQLENERRQQLADSIGAAVGEIGSSYFKGRIAAEQMKRENQMIEADRRFKLQFEGMRQQHQSALESLQQDRIDARSREGLEAAMERMQVGAAIRHGNEMDQLRQRTEVGVIAREIEDEEEAIADIYEQVNQYGSPRQKKKVARLERNLSAIKSSDIFRDYETGGYSQQGLDEMRKITSEMLEIGRRVKPPPPPMATADLSTLGMQEPVQVPIGGMKMIPFQGGHLMITGEMRGDSPMGRFEYIEGPEEKKQESFSTKDVLGQYNRRFDPLVNPDYTMESAADELIRAQEAAQSKSTPEFREQRARTMKVQSAVAAVDAAVRQMGMQHHHPSQWSDGAKDAMRETIGRTLNDVDAMLKDPSKPLNMLSPEDQEELRLKIRSLISTQKIINASAG